jgi:hypothetical protein
MPELEGKTVLITGAGSLGDIPGTLNRSRVDAPSA